MTGCSGSAGKARRAASIRSQARGVTSSAGTGDVVEGARDVPFFAADRRDVMQGCARRVQALRCARSPTRPVVGDDRQPIRGGDVAGGEERLVEHVHARLADPGQGQ